MEEGVVCLFKTFKKIMWFNLNLTLNKKVKKQSSETKYTYKLE